MGGIQPTRLPEPFSPRETEILRLIKEGLTNQEIARTLFLSLQTVKWYNQQIFAKLGVNNRTRAIEQARRYGLIELPAAVSEREIPRPKHNLPAPLSSFIGRKHELEELHGLLMADPIRLVTLAGSGGVGKTHLALQAAKEVLDAFPEGVWFVEFAPLSNPALVPQTILTTLSLIDQARRPPLAVLADFLQDKQALLILDNCEHLIQACAKLAETLLRACPKLRILATSREGLGVPGEVTFFIPTLTTPDVRHMPPVEALGQYEAVELFIERARASLPDFALTPANAPAVARVCQQLDGIPLALELAAVRVKLLRVEQIAFRLDDRFRLLTGGARTELPRHQTLQALIDWSYDLLSEPERVLLRRLSVFAGGWTLEAAEAVCAEDLTPSPPSRPSEAGDAGKGAGGLGRMDILDLLASLVNKSLVIAERKPGQEARYRMLETIRQYAGGKLASEKLAGEKPSATGEGERMRLRHLAYFVEIAERAEANLRAFDKVIWLDRLEGDLDNIRLALEWALENDIEAQLRLASALLWFWHSRGHANAGVDWLERGLSIESAERGDRPLSPGRGMIRGKALNACGTLLGYSMSEKTSAHLEESQALFQELGPAGKQGLAYALLRPRRKELNRSRLEQSLVLFREIGDKFGMAECLRYLASCAVTEKDFKQAVVFVEEDLALRREIGDLDGPVALAGGMSEVAFWQDDYQQHIALLEKKLADHRQVGNKWDMGIGLNHIGGGYFWQGDFKQAANTFEESLRFAQDLGDRFLIAYSSYNLGIVTWLRGDDASGIQIIQNGLALIRDEGPYWLAASSQHALGGIALAQGDGKRAAQWFEAELAVSREKSFEVGLIFAQYGLGKVAWAQDNLELAAQRFKEGWRLSQEVSYEPAVIHALCGLGRVAQSRGEEAAAVAFFKEALEIHRQGTRHPNYPIRRWGWLKTYGASAGYPLGALAVLAANQHQMERAARLFGAAEALYPPLRFEMSALEWAEHDKSVSAARLALGGQAFAAAWAAGQLMTLEQAIQEALAHGSDSTP